MSENQAEDVDVNADDGESPPQEDTTEKKTAAKKTTAKKEPDFSKGSVKVEELKVNTRDSDSVRRLQARLGLEVTGDYDAQTMEAVRVWQNSNGFVGGRGRMIGEEQASRLFGKGYSVKA